MTRFRLTVSTEWDVDPAAYGTDVVAEQLAIDQANAEDDPMGFLGIGDTALKVVVEDISYDKGGVPGGVFPRGITNVKLFKADL